MTGLENFGVVEKVAEEAQTLLTRAEYDVRKDVPDVLGALGVNTADEHQMFHALLAFVVKGLLGKLGTGEAAAVIDEIVSVA